MMHLKNMGPKNSIIQLSCTVNREKDSMCNVKIKHTKIMCIINAYAVIYPKIICMKYF